YTGGIKTDAENVGKHPNYKAIPALRYCPRLGDASVRRGWFWNPNQSRGPKWWKQIYFNCVGRGSSMMYGFAPDRRGQFPEEDIAGAVALKTMLDEIQQTDFAAGKPITADTTWKSIAGHEVAKSVDGDPLSYWSADESSTSATLEVDLGKPCQFNVVNLQEPVFMGQRVKKYRVEYLDGETWKSFSEGTTIGHRKLDHRAAVTASKVRLIIDDARAYPLISTFSLHFTSFIIKEAKEKKTGTREEKAI
ncbi:MAG TPA: discoidin domain-containing protein, partial [Luteolibacter sp.]|nr:discoidin domain-containing protein [Luteolibacter sp.]